LKSSYAEFVMTASHSSSLADVSQYLGFVHLKRGLYKRAIFLLNKSIEFYESVGNHGSANMSLLASAICLERNKDYALAKIGYGAVLENIKGSQDMSLLWDLISSVNHFATELSTKSTDDELDACKDRLMLAAKERYGTLGKPKEESKENLPMLKR